MASKSKTADSQSARNKLAVSGAKTFADQLPQDCADAAASLDKRGPVIDMLNAQQEAARAALRKATDTLKKELAAAAKERQKIIRYAEAKFGPRAAEIVQFRSKTDSNV